MSIGSNLSTCVKKTVEHVPKYLSKHYLHNMALNNAFLGSFLICFSDKWWLQNGINKIFDLLSYISYLMPKDLGYFRQSMNIITMIKVIGIGMLLAYTLQAVELSYKYNFGIYSKELPSLENNGDRSKDSPISKIFGFCCSLLWEITIGLVTAIIFPPLKAVETVLSFTDFHPLTDLAQKYQ